MYELAVVAVGARWVLIHDEDGELGDFDSRAAALTAAGDYASAIDPELRHVLIRELSGEWDEVAVTPATSH